MKQNSSISSLFGITQQEMAMLLGVGQSQFSMFECGKRDLPLPAKQLLAEMLTYKNTVNVEDRKVSDRHSERSKQRLEREMVANEYQRLLLEKKIALLEKKHKKENGLQLLAGFLNTQSDKRKKQVHQMFIKKLLKACPEDVETEMIAHKVQLETLILEKLLLEGKLKEFA